MSSNKKTILLAAGLLAALASLTLCCGLAVGPYRQSPPPTFSEQERQELREALDVVRSQGFYSKTVSKGSTVQVWTGPNFSSMDFEEKSNLCATVYSVHFLGGPHWDSGTVKLIDNSNGKEIGTFDMRSRLKIH